MKILNNVYYYHAEHGCWKPSFIISEIKDKSRFIVAGYGPSFPLLKVVPEDEYIKLVDTKEIEGYTQQVKEVK